MRRQNLAVNIGLIIITLLILIGGAEIGLRITGIEKGHVVPPPLYASHPDSDLSYTLKPNLREHAFRSTIITDAHGFRSSEIDPAKPMIAMLGDSIVFGYGVENGETLPAQLNALLPAYNVINAAAPGYNLMQERAIYEHNIRSLNPVALVLVFYWNDLRDMIPGDLGPDGNLYPRGQIPPPDHCSPITEGVMGWIPGKCWLDTHSAVYRVMKKLVIQKSIKQNQQENETREGTDLTFEYLTEENLQKYSQELTTLTQLLPKNMPRLFVIWPESPLHFAMRPELKKIAGGHGFKVLDLYEIFGNSPETLSWDSVHPSPATLQKAATVIGSAMKGWGMVP